VYGLEQNTSGNDNTASGYQALDSNTIGNYNTASGDSALYSNTTADYNTALGYQALYGNTTGQQNTAVGTEALNDNKAGHENTAVGMDALHSNKGSSNIALGWKAGYSVTTGSNNIDIGSEGVAGDSAVIRLGAISTTGQSTQIATYIAGISGVTVSGTGVAVVVNSNGQLGIAGSSERFKTAVAPMGSATSKLDQLRPVTFRYKNEPQGPQQYGLIAEEVAKVYPELVVRNDKGDVISVRYDELAPMLLNEVQQQGSRPQRFASFWPPCARCRLPAQLARCVLIDCWVSRQAGATGLS